MEIVRFFLSGVCHQLPERSLHYAGQPLPLCARCTGTFLGVVVGLLALWLGGHGRRSALPSRGKRLFLLALAAWWAVDGLNSFLALGLGRGVLYEPSNVLRLATGLGLGAAMAAVLYPIYHFALWRERDRRASLEGRWALPGLLATEVAAGVLLLAWRSAPYALWAGLAVAAVAVTLALVNGTLVALVTHRDGLARRWTQVLPYLAGGLLLSLGETGTLALLRCWLGA